MITKSEVSKISKDVILFICARYTNGTVGSINKYDIETLLNSYNDPPKNPELSQISEDYAKTDFLKESLGSWEDGKMAFEAGWTECCNSLGLRESGLKKVTNEQFENLIKLGLIRDYKSPRPSIELACKWIRPCRDLIVFDSTSENSDHTTYCCSYTDPGNNDIFTSNYQDYEDALSEGLSRALKSLLDSPELIQWLPWNQK